DGKQEKVTNWACPSESSIGVVDAPHGLTLFRSSDEPMLMMPRDRVGREGVEPRVRALLSLRDPDG
ncbi:MAG: hypothetical protein WED34_11840, partial [Planctomycetales bacterium]